MVIPMYRQTRPGKSRLKQFFAEVDGSNQSLLPLAHTTDAYRFSDMLIAGEITPVQCPVFEEKLVYAFVGKPAYRTRSQTNDRLHFDLPVVVLFKTDMAGPPLVRVFPFDTGAFEKGLYSRFFHPDTELADFELGSTYEQALKYLSFFYQNAKEYFLGASGKNVEIPFNQFETTGLHELARAPADPTADSRIPADERASSIEIQFSGSLSLAGNTLAVIIPQQYLDIPQVSEALKDINPKYLKTYEVFSKMGSREIAGIIYEITRQIYLEEGHI